MVDFAVLLWPLRTIHQGIDGTLGTFATPAAATATAVAAVGAAATAAPAPAPTKQPQPT